MPISLIRLIRRQLKMPAGRGWVAAAGSCIKSVFTLLNGFGSTWLNHSQVLALFFPSVFLLALRQQQVDEGGHVADADRAVVPHILLG